LPGWWPKQPQSARRRSREPRSPETPARATSCPRRNPTPTASRHEPLHGQEAAALATELLDRYREQASPACPLHVWRDTCFRNKPGSDASWVPASERQRDPRWTHYAPKVGELP